MIRKIDIIFTFILIIFSISKVEAMSGVKNIEDNISMITNEEKETEENIDYGNSTFTIWVLDKINGTKVENVKVLVENINYEEPRKYISNSEGIIKITNLGKGEVKIKVLDVTEEYYFEETEIIREIGYNMEDGYFMRLTHKLGAVLIKTNVPGSAFAIQNKFYYSIERTDENGEIYIQVIDTGSCIITQREVSEEYELAEPVVINVKENETYEVIIMCKKKEDELEEIITDENEDTKTEDINREDTEKNDGQEQDDFQEIEEEKKQEGIKQEEIEKEEQKDPENEENLSNKDQIESIENAEDSKEEINKNENDKVSEEKNEELEKNNNPEQGNTQNSEEEKKQENIKREETKKEDPENEENLLNKDQIETIENGADSKEETTKIENNNQEVSDTSFNQMTAEQNNKEIIEGKQTEITKLPRTGNDYLILKILFLDLLIFITFLTTRFIKKAKLKKYIQK